MNDQFGEGGWVQFMKPDTSMVAVDVQGLYKVSEEKFGDFPSVRLYFVIPGTKKLDSVVTMEPYAEVIRKLTASEAERRTRARATA